LRAEEIAEEIAALVPFRPQRTSHWPMKILGDMNLLISSYRHLDLETGLVTPNARPAMTLKLLSQALGCFSRT
jgi:hypothetical protein